MRGSWNTVVAATTAAAVVAIGVIAPAGQVGAGQAAPAAPVSPAGLAPAPAPAFELAGRYATGLGAGSGEIVAHADGTMYVINSDATTVDVVDLSDPTDPTKTGQVDLAPYGDGVTSVDAHGGLAVAAVVADPSTDPGTLVFFAPDGTIHGTVVAGALPDMVTFSPDGRRVYAANEGEPSSDYSVDPEGSVSIVEAGPFRSVCSYPEGGFSDVDEDDLFYDEIRWLVERCGSLGLGDGSWGRTATMNRQFWAAFAYRQAGAPLGDDPTCTEAPFPDVPADDLFCGEIAWLVDQGITTGNPDGTFGPGQPVLRQTAAAFTMRAAGVEAPGCTEAPFDDVPVSSPFCPAIAWMVDQGLASGFGDGRFGPAQPITREAAASIEYRDTLGMGRTVTFTDFDEGQPRAGEVDPDIRIFGPGASVAQDLEPEYVALAGDHGFVSLQENNALARFDARTGHVEALLPLGHKDHSVEGMGLDPSDRDADGDEGAINIAPWPLHGMFMPDGVAAFTMGDDAYVVTANEGDAREYDGFEEEERIKDLTLDPTAFPNAAALQEDEALGRLTVTTATGDTDGDGDLDELHSFGGRSFSIFDAEGQLLFDSGDAFERITADVLPGVFNSDNDEVTFDTRSDAKGPEPEGVAVGQVGGRMLAFVGLERIGGVMVYDITEPADAWFVQYLNTRDYGQDAAPDSAPEGLEFVAAEDSPTGSPLLLVSYEESGTVTIFETTDRDGAGTLTLLHNNDGESSLLPILNNPPQGVAGDPVPVGGVSAFATLTEAQISEARSAGSSVLNVYSGDSFLASATLACSLPPGEPVYDALAQSMIAYDAHAFGNHEFDYGPDFLERYLRAFERNGRLEQPFLAANLDFSAEPGFADLVVSGGLFVAGETTEGQVVARSAVVTDQVTTQRFGVVGAITPALPTISSPRDVAVTTADLAETAAAVQAEIDRLAALGVHKVVLVSHLQDVDNDRELVKLLKGVDIAVAGGGDELLINDDAQKLPYESAGTYGTYPLTEIDAMGRAVHIVTTAGNYKYLGRFDVVFDPQGEVAYFDVARSYPRRVVPESDEATALGVVDQLAGHPAIEAAVVAPVEDCLEALAATPVARSEVMLDTSRSGVRGGESNVGNLIADSFLHAYDLYADDNDLPPAGPENPVVAVQNGGGIRQNAGDSLPKGGAPGVLSEADVLDVLPFTNFVTVVEDVTAAELKEVLERAASGLPGAGGQFLQIGGFEVTYDPAMPVGSRVLEVDLPGDVALVDAGAVVPGAPEVTLVTNNFTADGGDDFAALAAIGAERKTNLITDTGQLLYYAGAWRTYLLSFPASGDPALPTVDDADPRYAYPDGDGRITILTP